MITEESSRKTINVDTHTHTHTHSVITSYSHEVFYSCMRLLTHERSQADVHTDTPFSNPLFPFIPSLWKHLPFLRRRPLAVYTSVFFRWHVLTSAATLYLCSHSANFSTLSHTHTHTLTQYMSTHKKTHTEGRAHAQLVNSPAAANRWQQASGWRKIVWVGWKRRAKNTCLFRQHPDVLRVFLSVRCGQEIRQEEMRAVHY